MTPQEFIRKWKPVALTERATAHTHFNDLCALVGHDDPVAYGTLSDALLAGARHRPRGAAIAGVVPNVSRKAAPKAGRLA